MVNEKTSNSELIDMFNKTLKEEFLVAALKCTHIEHFDELLIAALKYQYYIKFNTVLTLTVREFEPKKRDQVIRIAYEHFIELEKKLVASTKKFTPQDKARIIRAVRKNFLWWVKQNKVLSQKDMSCFWKMIKKSIRTRLPY